MLPYSWNSHPLVFCMVSSRLSAFIFNLSKPIRVNMNCVWATGTAGFKCLSHKAGKISGTWAQLQNARAGLCRTLLDWTSEILREILPIKLAVKITKAVRSQTATNSFLSNVQFSRRETGLNTMNIFAFSISVSHSHSLSSCLHSFCSVSLGSDARNSYFFFFFF